MTKGIKFNFDPDRMVWECLQEVEDGVMEQINEHGKIVSFDVIDRMKEGINYDLNQVINLCVDSDDYDNQILYFVKDKKGVDEMKL